MFIRQIAIKNYRSLRDVQIGNLSPIVVFYGDNDSGKSNILSFLEQLFKTKFIQEELTIDGAKNENAPVKPSGFWRGEIENFADNFYRNQSEAIEFSIVVRFDRSEVETLGPLPEKFLEKLSDNNANINLKLVGQISQAGSNRASMKLLEATFNNISFYDGKVSEPKYLPGFDLSPAEGLNLFNRILGSLDDAFLRIPTDRYLALENELPKTQKAELRRNTFKNWLFQTSLNRDDQKLFQTISERFAGQPFGHGRISLARVGDHIEVFVEGNDGLKLPIGRKGSGIQQLLMILSYVALYSSPIVGIEELEINLSPKSQSFLFDNLKALVEAPDSPIKQIFITTHSPSIAKRSEAACRGVWMNAERETQVGLRTEAQITEFFNYP
jgi:hypothetical protein